MTMVVIVKIMLMPQTLVEISRGAPDPDPDPPGYPVNLVDPGRIRIRLDPMYLDPAWIWIQPDLR